MSAGSFHFVQRLGLAEFGPVEAIERDQGETDHGDDERAGHVILVSDGPHEFGQDGAAHDGHDNVGGSPFRAGAETMNAEGKDGGEHDGHEEIAQEQADHGQPAQLAKDQQAGDDIQDSVKTEHLVGGEFFQNACTGKPSCQETEKARRGEISRCLVADRQNAMLVQFKTTAQNAGVP